MNTSPYITGLQLPKSRRKARSPQEIFAEKAEQLKLKTFSQLGECFSVFIPGKLLHPAKSGALSRQRLFSKKNTFWAFFSQVMDADSGCKEAVRKLQASVAVKLKSVPSSSTAAYCKARKKLELTMFESIHKHLTDHLKSAASADYLNGRRVIVVDGTGVSMPDTEENQKEWPQLRSQKPGCGFPQAFICACFNLNNGALLSHKTGDKKSSELPMLREQWGTFKKDDIFLGDKGFCSYYDQSNLKDIGVDSIITLARRTPVSETNAVKVLGQNDLLIHWIKPKRNKRSSYSQEGWEALPETLSLRQVKVIVRQPGFRTKSFYIITTLLG